MDKAEAHRLHQKRYRERNKAKIAAYEAVYRAENRDAINAYRRSYYADWRARNKDKVAAYMAKWQAANPQRAAQAPFVDPKFTDKLFALIHSLVPNGISRDRRDDIMSDLYVGVLEGTYPPALTAEHIKLAMRSHNKRFSLYDTVSLDEKLGDRTRAQALGIY